MVLQHMGGIMRTVTCGGAVRQRLLPQTKEDAVYCRFRGAFTAAERNRLERAVAALDHGTGAPWVERVAWLMMCANIESEAVYVAVRLSDGWTARARSVDALIAVLEDAGRSAPPQSPRP